MKRFTLAIISFLCCCAFTHAAVGDTIEVDHYYLKITADEDEIRSVEAIGHDHDNNYTIEVMNIPSTLTYNNIEYTLTSIADSAFSSCSSHSFIIPPTVTRCGNGAFPQSIHSDKDKDAYPSTISNPFILTTGKENTDAVEYPVEHCLIDYENNCIYSDNGTTLYYVPANRSGEFVIPENVTVIGTKAFIYCDKITSVVVHDGVTAINGSAFRGCSSLANINIPESVTLIDIRGFSGTGIESIYLPDGITILQPEIFNGCTKLKEVRFPKNLKSIRYSCFMGCTSITGVELPSTLTNISENAFRSMTNLSSITIPHNVTNIGPWTFLGDTKLVSADLPNSLTRLAYSSFSGCRALTSIVLPNVLSLVESSSFKNCSALEDATIGYGVNQIAANAFIGCSSLKSFSITAEEPPTIAETSFPEAFKEGTVYVLPQSFEKYQADTIWRKYNIATLNPLTQVEIDPFSIPQDLYTGQTFTPSLIFTPADADAQMIYWTSTNPDVVSVDHYTGEVTVHQPEYFNSTMVNTDLGAQIMATSLYRGVTDEYPKRQELTGINSIDFDNISGGIANFNIYNLQGVCIKSNATRAHIEHLPKGVYIINNKKVFIK